MSLFVVGAIGAGVVLATNAFFSDTETSVGNTFTAGRLDLKVNGQDNPSAVVSFNDLKPGDNILVNKDLYVDFNPAKIWLHVTDLQATQGAQTEPEIVEENGVPKFDIQNYITYDLKLSSPSATTIIDFNNGVLLPDAVSCWIPIGLIPGATHVTMEQSFHFDPTVTNWAQGDVLTFTEEFLAQQKNDPTIPDTGSGRVWNPELRRCVPRTTPTPTPSPTPTPTPTPTPVPSPTPIACIQTFPNSFEQVAQGVRKDGSAVLAARSDGNLALGAPQTTGIPVDPTLPGNYFFSLGFKLANPVGPGGSIVLKFAQPFFNQIGNDLQVYEVTGATTPPYPDEKVKVEVSPNGSTWTTVAASLTRDGGVDISPVPSAQYVRLTDVSTISLFPNDADGYDLDAVRANCGTQ